MRSINETRRPSMEEENENFSPTENPTREYLNNLKKIDLQKLCRQLGLQKVYQPKQRLIEMLLLAYRTQESTNEDENDNQHATGIINRILKEMEEIKENLAAKDSEINELNLMLKSANVTINRLNDRISTLEERTQHQSASDIIPTPAKNESVLLIGDSNLNEIRLADLGENCKVKTIKDTTIDLTGCWIREKLDLVPSKCIIYCGTNDLKDTENYSSVLDDLGSLITELKHKNEDVDIYICELAPHMNTDIDDRINLYNEKLMEWCSVNGVMFIKTNLSFRLGTGDIDELCYDYEENILDVNLNRYGVLRLLEVINKQCEYMKLNENFKINKRQRKTSDHYNNRQYNRDSYGHFSKGRSLELGQFRHEHRSQYLESSTNNERPTDHRQTFRDLPRRVPYNRNTYYNAENHYEENRNRNGCFNCGEYNHRRSNCRYDHQIRCNNCYEYGHKSRMCNPSSY